MMKRLYLLPALSLSLLLVGGSMQYGIAAKLGIFQSHKDIGITPHKGKVHFDSKKDQYTVTGGGDDIWATQDDFQYVYKQISGDVTLTADISFLGTGTEPHRKAALMIRQSLEPGAAYADAAVHGDGLTSLQCRAAAGATTTETRSELKAPAELRLERHGNQFTMFAGNKGEELKPTGPMTVQLQDPVYLGLAVCAHNTNLLETAVFSNIKVTSGGRQATDNRMHLLALLQGNR